MRCLMGYASNPSFLDAAYVAAIRGIREKIHHLQFSINEQLNIAIKNNLSFDVSRTPEGIQCMELQKVINRLREEAKAQNKSNTPAQTGFIDKGKGKKPVDSVPSPISEKEEQGTIPLVTKRKRLSPIRARTSSAPQASSAPQVSTISTPQNAGISPAPSPDEDDHLTIKKLKVKHSFQTSIQPSQPQLAQIATSTPEIMNLDDSDEEQDLQGLKTSIFNKFPSLLPQTTTTSTALEQPELGQKQSESKSRVE